MTFKELINRHPWAGVKYQLMELYPGEAYRIDAYAEVYETLVSLSPHPTDMRIVVKEVFDPEFDDKPHVDVSGCNGSLQKEQEEFAQSGRSPDSEFANSEVCYAIEFTPWEEWLGMAIEPATLAAFDEVGVIAHCLWEMTFAGFDQEDIQQQIRGLRETVDEIKDMTEEERKERLRPFDFGDLEEESGGGDDQRGESRE